MLGITVYIIHEKGEHVQHTCKTAVCKNKRSYSLKKLYTNLQTSTTYVDHYYHTTV